MAQWVNRLRNNIFVNPPPLPLLCEISGALHLAQPGLTAGWLAGRLAGWQADEIWVNFEIFKVGLMISTTVLNDIYYIASLLCIYLSVA